MLARINFKKMIEIEANREKDKLNKVLEEMQ